jgi:enamine deaminase RidA (YjgF/YER057c/UK114 family)
MPRRLVASGSPFEAEIAYSRAVALGPWVLVAGTTGFDYRTMAIDPDPARQCEQALDNIEAALAEVDAGLADLVRVRYILPDPADFPPCWPVLRRRLGAARPAATMLVAGLIDPRLRIEIEATAYRAEEAAPPP